MISSKEYALDDMKKRYAYNFVSRKGLRVLLSAIAERGNVYVVAATAPQVFQSTIVY